MEAIPNTSSTSDGTHTGIRLEEEQRKDHCELTSGVIKEFSEIFLKTASKQKTTVMEELTKEFKGKMQSLKFSLDINEEVIGSKNTEAIARHGALLMSKLQAVHTIKESIVEQKFTEGESEEEDSTWMKEFDGFLKEVDERALALRQLVEKMEEKCLAEFVLAKAKHDKRMSQERELLDQQMKFQKAVEASQQDQNAKKMVSAKLPKLTMIKFDGSYENWLPFINKFEVEIHKTDLPPVTKFAYLKELLKPKVRAEIDGLPLTT